MELNKGRQMTETEWLLCTDDPWAMRVCRHRLMHGRARRLFGLISGRLPGSDSPRKELLARCAVCRRFGERVSWFDWPRAVDTAEHAADGVGKNAINCEAATAVREAAAVLYGMLNDYEQKARYLTEFPDTIREWEDFRRDFTVYRCDIERELYGNPFRPTAFDPRWGTETALALAECICADRAFDRLPILADALEEAGCDDGDVLSHCRGPGPHVCGCWVVDLVLGKK